MTYGECALNGSGPQAIAINTQRMSQDAGANSTTFRVQLWYLGKGWGSWTNSTQYWSISGQINISGSFTIPQGTNDVYLAEHWFTLYHDGNGNLGAWGVTGCIDTNHSTIGDGCCGVTEPAAPRLGQAPGAPGTPNISDITPVSVTLSWSGAPRGRADITNYQWEIWVAGGSSRVIEATGGVFYADNTGDNGTLNPGTAYSARVRALNGDGWGPWSGWGNFTTLPSGPALLTSVTPNATGTSATIVMAPPSGITSVNSYKIEARTPGGSWTVMASGSGNPSQTVAGLVPGQTYEWRASAVVGSYTSPTSTTITRTQPQPNASPGAFWNGDTTDTPSTNYTWTGTAGASTSQAQTLTGGAVGWLSGAQAVAKCGGTAVQYQVAGGIEPNGNGGVWAVRYVMLTGATSNGFRAGTNGSTGYADVTVNGRYMGSLWVQPSRERTLAAMWVWYDASGAEIGTTLGGSVQVGTSPVRLNVLGTAPTGAVKGAVVVTDPAGSSMMAAGDTLTVDANMGSTGTLYPYFDGDTVDTSAFIYDWEDQAQTSASFREDVPRTEQDPLRDPDCPPLPTPPSPPTIEDDCITPVGSWRRAWYQIDASRVPSYLSAVPTVILETFGYPESQVRIRWYANPSGTSPLEFDASSWEFEQIISYIPPCSEVTLDGVSRRVWAVVGDRTGTGTAADPYVCVPGEYPTIPADSLLYGTGGVPATWPVVSCGINWLVSLDTPLDAPAGNLTVSANLTTRE